MSVVCNNYDIEEETLLKSLILTRGVEFSHKVMKFSLLNSVKTQNLAYNMPVNATSKRPQELIIKNEKDNYEVVVSCVARNSNLQPVYIDLNNSGEIVSLVDGEKIDNIKINFVKEPEYYQKIMQSGECVKKYVSACGLDELNIIPWQGCAISKTCKFCGINNFITPDGLSAQKISKNKEEWYSYQEKYFQYLKEAVSIALQSKCYKDHVHIILIAGNLKNDCLDFESEIFADIARHIYPLVQDKSYEGIVAVLTPPENYKCIDLLKKAGVSKVVFNLEAITENAFKKYCPGKYDLTYQFFIDRLKYAINVFGRGNVWTNLVFGLEKKDDILYRCDRLIREGIVISANVLHLDKGNSVDCYVPQLNDVIDFYYKLDQMNSNQGFVPFYCSKALRTSLSNEVHELRIRRANYK